MVLCGFREAGNREEDVVELVRDAARQRAERLALVRATEAVPVEDVYDSWALNALVSRIQVAKRALSAELSAASSGLEAWMSENSTQLESTAEAISEILDGCDVGLSKLIVAVGHVDELAQ